MPGFKTHAQYGIITALILAFTIIAMTGSIAIGILTALSFFTGSCFPDIDISSHSQRWIAFCFAGALTYAWYHTHTWGYALGMATLCPLLAKHRGLFHNPWFLAICSAITACIIYASTHNMHHATLHTASFFAGTMLHLGLDNKKNIRIKLKSLKRLRPL